MRSPIAFAAERGIDLSANAVAYHSEALAVPYPVEPGKVLRARGAAADRPGLHYLRAVLVSTGWNKNDDVFDGLEVWAARATPEDKPFNFEHDQSDVIGHITDCEPAADGEPLSVTAADELPAHYQILTGAVLYTALEDPAKAERMRQILTELPQGRWFVSMEAIFTGFDYAVRDGATSKVIARTADTAFLTKHLRAYGGGGTYDGMKVGRLLRNITFSGKGLVRKPANPESVIFASVTPFVRADASLVYSVSKGNENKMDEVKTLTAQLAEAREALAAAEKARAAEKAEGEAKAKADAEAKRQAVEAELAATKAAAADWQKKAEDAQAAEKAAAAKLAEAEEKARAAARLASIKESLGATDEEAADFLTKYAALADEQFNSLLEAQASYMAKKLAGVKTGETDVTNKAKPAGGGSKPVKTVKMSLKQPPLEPAVETAEGSDESTPVVADEDEFKTLAADMAAYYGVD